jgi:sugar (pentulose or hexulose) kinase
METMTESLPNVLWNLDGQGTGAPLDWNPGEPLPPRDGLPWLHLNYADRDVREWLLDSGLLTPPVAESLLDEETRPRVLHHGNGLLLTLRGVNLNPGAEPEDIVAGVQNAIAKRLSAMAGRKADEPVVFTGGVALVSGMVDAVAAVLGRPVRVVPEPQFTGAIGAALLAARQ